MASVLGLGCASSDNGSATGSGGTTGGGSGGSSGTGGSSGSGGATTGSGGASSTTGTGGTVAGSGGNSGSGGSAADAAVDKPAGTDGGSSSETGVPAAGCTGLTTKYCDDFEMQTDGKAPTGTFTINGPAGSVVVDTTKPYDGTKSMHFKLPKPGPTAQLSFTKQFPMDEFFGRAMMYMTRVPGNDNHWDLLYSYFGQTEWELGGQSGVFELVCDPGGNKPELDNSSKTKFPVGKWVCLQWHFKNGMGAGNTYTVKVDGTAVDKGDFTGNQWPAGTFQNMSFGWVTYPSSGSDVDIEFWIDDLAFGAQEIACPAAP
ncbi:MAG TPA: hypothetical protein VH374_23935 [Polyangia bacterium]|jgi:hypothetical protein|nr:hypothetical protein [Polyangia bacterium]